MLAVSVSRAGRVRMLLCSPPSSAEAPSSSVWKAAAASAVMSGLPAASIASAWSRDAAGEPVAPGCGVGVVELGAEGGDLGRGGVVAADGGGSADDRRHDDDTDHEEDDGDRTDDDEGGAAASDPPAGASRARRLRCCADALGLLDRHRRIVPPRPSEFPGCQPVPGGRRRRPRRPWERSLSQSRLPLIHF